VLDSGERRVFQTDLKSVYVPYPPPHAESGQRVLTCGLALQASPTKELLSEFDLGGLTRRERRALSLVEGGAAVGWAAQRWPGLSRDLERLVPEVPKWSADADGSMLVEAAMRMARDSRADLNPPALLGALPGAVRVPTRVHLARRVGARLPWSKPNVQHRIPRQINIPIGGSGGMAAPRNGVAPSDEPDEELSRGGRLVGLPYPEWNVYTKSYRRGFVRVIEVRGGSAPSRRVVAPPEIARWFRRSPDRVWYRGLEDGSSLDVEAYVAELCDQATGAQTPHRIYAELAMGPRDVATAVLLDQSASLSADRSRAMQLQLVCADALAAALGESGEPHAIFAFSGDTRNRVVVRVVREFGDLQPGVPSIAGLEPHGYTRLGAPIRHLTRRLLDVPASRRILLSIGDGLPSDEGYEGEYAQADVAKAVEEAVESGIVVYHVGVGRVRRDPLMEMFGRHRCTRITRLSDLPRVLAAVHEELCER
jgi:hypothetical protein